MTLKALASAVVALLLMALPLAAQTPPPSPLPAPESETVSDLARVLDPTEEGRIRRLLEEMREETGVEMAVVTLPDLALYGGGGMRLDAYAKALFNAWGVGGAERNDGILMLASTGDREVRIALGSGYDAVYDGRAARVLTTAVLPEFREGRLAAGIEAGIVSARERLVAPFLEGRPVTLDEGFETEGGGAVWWGLGAVAALAGLGTLIVKRSRAKRQCPRCGALTLTRQREVIDPPTRKASGSGIEHQSCSSCGFIERKIYTIPRLRREPPDNDRLGGGGAGGGSASGGFGGGRSSGGGASGKW